MVCDYDVCFDVGFNLFVFVKEVFEFVEWYMILRFYFLYICDLVLNYIKVMINFINVIFIKILKNDYDNLCYK